MHAMNPRLLEFLCDPVDKSDLTLKVTSSAPGGGIIAGELLSQGGRVYPIVDGIPRFVDAAPPQSSVESFGDEWNHFNFIDFKAHWLNHTIKNTFGNVDVLKGKVVVDAGCGSGSQTLWALQAGTEYVVGLELSHSVDGVIRRNLESSGFENYDIIQCSIDQPPLKDRSIPGIVICHNVIQHTPDVEKTAEALFRLVGAGGEFVFNCYPKNDEGLIRWLRFHGIYQPLRKVLSQTSFETVHTYAKGAGVISLLPGLGKLIEKAGAIVTGDVVTQPSDGFWTRAQKRYRATVLNTFDAFGTHEFQHHKSDAEINALVDRLQPDATKVKNREAYFSRPKPIGCALRVLR